MPSHRVGAQNRLDGFPLGRNSPPDKTMAARRRPLPLSRSRGGRRLNLPSVHPRYCGKYCLGASPSSGVPGAALAYTDPMGGFNPARLVSLAATGVLVKRIAVFVSRSEMRVGALASVGPPGNAVGMALSVSGALLLSRQPIPQLVKQHHA